VTSDVDLDTAALLPGVPHVPTEEWTINVEKVDNFFINAPRVKDVGSAANSKVEYCKPRNS
jgi:hypothetical protein